MSQWVYVIKPEHVSVYKIGQTTDLEGRIKKIRSKFDFDVRYILTIQVADSFQSEQIVHSKIGRFHLGGDWFALTESALSEIVEFMKGLS